MGRGARVTDLPTEDIEDIWAEMDDLSDEIEGVKDSVGLSTDVRRAVLVA